MVVIILYYLNTSTPTDVRNEQKVTQKLTLLKVFSLMVDCPARILLGRM